MSSKIQNNVQTCSIVHEDIPKVAATPFTVAATTEGSLPCLYRNNSTEIHRKPNKDLVSEALAKRLDLDKKYRKTSTALAYNSRSK